MSKRQKRVIGSILEIELNNGFYSYAQIINADIMVYDLYIDKTLSDISVLQKTAPLFFIGVYDDIITKGKWIIKGELPVREEHQIVPHKFIQDAINADKFKLYKPNTGDITRATREECEGLECAAVWEAEHVESRIKDYYEGKSNVWLEQLKIK